MTYQDVILTTQYYGFSKADLMFSYLLPYIEHCVRHDVNESEMFQGIMPYLENTLTKCERYQLRGCLRELRDALNGGVFSSMIWHNLMRLYSCFYLQQQVRVYDMDVESWDDEICGRVFRAILHCPNDIESCRHRIDWVTGFDEHNQYRAEMLANYYAEI